MGPARLVDGREPVRAPAPWDRPHSLVDEFRVVQAPLRLLQVATV